MANWINKSKISATIPIGYLLTPDGNKILVGKDIDEVLIYQEKTDKWVKEPKTDEAGDWINKGKISV